MSAVVRRRLVDARPVPPYARKLGASRSLYVFAGSRAWAKAHATIGTALVLPEDRDPFAFRWPVQGCEVTAAWHGGATRDARRLFEALVAAEASRVVMVAPVYADSADLQGFEFEECTG